MILITGATKTGKTEFARKIAQFLIATNLVENEEYLRTEVIHTLSNIIGGTTKRVKEFLRKIEGGVGLMEHCEYMDHHGYKDELESTLSTSLGSEIQKPTWMIFTAYTKPKFFEQNKLFVPVAEIAL